MKLTTGLKMPSMGKIRIDGQPVTGPLKISGMAFQAPSLLPWRTTVDNVLLPLEIVEPYRSSFKAKRKEYVERARRLLQKVGLAGYEDKFPWQLSGGMQQRASICRALIHEPKMLLLDEPFGALDAFTREELWCILRDLWTEQQFNVILVTHDLRESVFLADTVYVMSKSPGRFVVKRDIELPRPRELELTYTKEFTDIVLELRSHIGAIRNTGIGAAQTPQCLTESAAMKNTKQIERWSPWLLLVAVLLLWQIVCAGFEVSDFIFPSPWRIWTQFWEYKEIIAGHAWRTFWVTMAGFGLAIVVGVLLGFVIGSSRLAYAAVYPLMTAFNALPKAAFVPILVVWFGIGVGPAILTAFLISFFPIMVNIATGLATLEPELEDVLRVLGAKRWDVLMKIGLPRSMPYFFGSLKVAITLAFVGTTVSEMTAANEGIGYLLISAGSAMQMGLAFAGLMVVGAMAMLMYELFSVIEKHTTGWAHRGSQNQCAEDANDPRADRSARCAAPDAVARRAMAMGRHPFGAVLVAPDGETVLAEQGNIDTVHHAEATLARHAALNWPGEYLWQCTLVTTFEPCAMCAGTSYWAHIGRVVYGAEESALLALTGDHPRTRR
jgi:NitT/TauT family transport system permease protein